MSAAHGHGSALDAAAKYFGGGKHYPDVPEPEPSAPPHPGGGADGRHGGWAQPTHDVHARAPPAAHGAPRYPAQQPGVAAGGPQRPGHVMVEPVKVEAQPWVLDLWRTLATRTVGVARIDLRRPTFLEADAYAEGNILFRRQAEGEAAPARHGRGRPPKQRQPAAVDPYAHNAPLYPGAGYNAPAAYEDERQGRRWPGLGIAGFGSPDGQPTGARFKLMRSLQLFRPDGGEGGVNGKRPLFDIGVGVNMDLDHNRLQGVMRIKLQDWMSVKLAPYPTVRLAKCWHIPGTGMALRARYECPMNHLDAPWRPPARLMVRLDQDTGSGVRLSPNGIEFDQQRLALGDSLQVRAAALLRFPRQIPFDPQDPDALKLEVHRLTLKSRW